MPGPITTDDLLTQVREQLDEANSDNITDAAILRVLNRAQRHAANILAKHYEDLFITSVQVTTTGTDTYDIPEAAYGRRVSKITVQRNSVEYPLKRITYHDLHKFTSSAHVSVPTVYALKNRSYVIKPTPISGVVLNVWYNAAPETLVLPQGRITSVSVGGSYVLVDALGTGLTTSTVALGAFVNVVDAQTGAIKVSLQTNALDTTALQVSFKTSGLTLSSVYNRTIATAIPTTVEVNDYLCAVQGNCVPDVPDACTDFLVQYSVNECRRRMGEPVQDERAMLDQMEAEVKQQWAGREVSAKITNRARHWTR